MLIQIRVSKPVRDSRITINPLRVSIPTRPMRILDFDIENRPLTYLGSDFTTSDVTAISWAWADDLDSLTVNLLGETSIEDILDAFVAVYNEADIVTGHYIRGHDLPIINGALMELQRPLLSDKPTQDTKLDLIKSKGISLSQESLGGMLGLEFPKVPMTQTKWRAANRLTPEGLAYVRERVTGDVKQHMAMRVKLRELGYLNPPVTWRSAAPEAYVP